MLNDIANAGVSVLNNHFHSLTAGEEWSGRYEECSRYASVVMAVKTDQAGTLYIDFSPDASNTDSTLSFSVAANVNEVHRITVTRRYFRVRFLNSGSNQTFFRLQSLVGANQALTSPLNGTIQTDADSLITRSTLIGQTDGGSFQYVPVTQEGHLEVAIHSPRLPFGAVHTESLTPIFQTDAVYGINSGQVSTFTSLTGGATASDSNFVVSTGTTATAQGVILGRKRLRYRPGQGVVARFTALFTTPVTYSYQVVGVGHSEDGVYFAYREATGNGYSGVAPAFGILYINRAYREVRTLTVSAGATSASNCTITLNTVAFTVPLTAASNIQRTVYEIANFASYTGWDASIGSATTVVFVRKAAQAASGTYSFAAGTTGAAASIAQTRAGAAGTETFIPQSTWNGDKLDGTGASGATLDPTKGNVYQIGIQYLGYGAIYFQVEVAPTDTNNTDFVTCHILKLPNTLTTTSFGNPAFPFTMAAYSAGSTTNLTVKVGSFAGFIEGQKILHGNRFSYLNNKATIGASDITALVTVMNTRYYRGQANQAVINLLTVEGAVEHNNPAVYYLIKNGTLAGNPSFGALATNSCSLYDTAATTVTYSTGDQLISTFHISSVGEFDYHFGGTGNFNNEEVTLQPGEWVTLGIKSISGNITFATGAINTREDQ